MEEAPLTPNPSPPSTGARGIGRLAWAVPLLAATLTGCVTTTTCLWPSEEDCPPKGHPCQVVCMWQNNVITAADSANGGTPLQGFAGRLYLFGPDGRFPLQAEGVLTVDLIDETYDPSKFVERWVIDSETLQRVLKKDIVGWGYTVFLPSKEYTPSMTKIRLRVAFQEPKAAPVFTQNAVTLAATNGVIRDVTNERPPLTMNTTPPPPPRMPYQPPIPVR